MFFQGQTWKYKIQAIWDQTDKTGTDVANTYAHFGRVYEKDEIDRAIEADNNGENPYSYVAQKRHVRTWNAAGFNISRFIYRRICWRCTGAELLVVKLKTK